MKKIYRTLAFVLFFGAVNHLSAQETDLFKEADEKAKQKSTERDYVTNTFKATRIVNGHSVETTPVGVLDFRVHHRFGFINSGSYELFGLDNATERMSFDYGITDRLAVGVGRSTYLKQYDGYVQYKLLRQTTDNHMPISLSILGATAIRTIKNTDPTKPYTSADKTAYTAQVILAKKLNSKTSIQLMPTMVHYNMVPLASDPNDLFSLGIAAKQRVSRRISLTAEYYHQFNKFDGYNSSLALGVDIETGGHVFQLHLTNSTGMTEPTFIHQTTGNFFDGDIHFGFNISRAFTLKRNKGSRTNVK